MARFNYRHQYDEEADFIAKANSITVPEGPSMTQQQFTHDVNINTMVKRMGVSDGALPPAAMDPRFYGDFTEAVDLRDVFDRVREATDRFNELPAELRSRFQNDPATLLAFVQDDRNAEEAIKLGLLARDGPEPAAASATTPAVPAG